MKKIYSILCILLLCNIPLSNAGPDNILLSCDFEDGAPENWDNIDIDESKILEFTWNNMKWVYQYAGEEDIKDILSPWLLVTEANAGKCFYSGSVLANSTVQQNDLLVTPSVKIPKEGAILMWKARSTGEIPKDYNSYEIRIFNTETYNGIIKDFEDGLIPNKNRLLTELTENSTRIYNIDGENPNWIDHEVSLEDYEGKDIRIAWLSNTIKGGGLALLIDNIAITSGLEGPSPVTNAWTQEFTGGISPMFWEMESIGWKPSSKWNNTEDLPYKNMNMIWFDTFTLNTAGQEGSLETFSFIPTGKCYTLQYDIETIIFNRSYITSEPGIGLMVEISTDDGVTFEPSDFNILSDMPAYEHIVNNASVRKVLETDLSGYLGQKIKVRLRGTNYRKLAGEHIILWKVIMKESAESVSPVIEEMSPKNGSKDVMVETPIFIEFDRNITATSLNKISMKKKSGEDVSIEPSISENKLTLDHTGDLEYNTEYEIIIPTTAIKALDKEIVWTFTTENVAVRVSETPENESTGVDLDAKVAVIYDKDITLSNTENIKIKDKNGVEVKINNITAEGKEVIIEHENFVNDMMYTVFVPAGSVKGVDIGYSWYFTTEVSLQEVSETPESGSTGIELDAKVALIYNKNITLGNTENISIIDDKGVKIEITKVTANEKELIMEHENFQPQTKYTVTVPANSVKGIEKEYKWEFTAGGVSIGSTTIDNPNTVYPVISDGNITVVSEAHAKIKVTDISGKLLSTYNSDGLLNISLGLNKGIYIIIIESDTISSHKIIIK